MNPHQLFMVGIQTQNTLVLASGAALSVKFYLDLIFKSCCNLNIMSTLNFIYNLVLAQLIYLTSTVENGSVQLQNLKAVGLLPGDLEINPYRLRSAPPDPLLRSSSILIRT